MAIIDRIKFDGLKSSSWLIFKYPGEQFSTSSQLIVGEGQIAVFFKGGQACDYFTPGTHKLSTPNLPILSSIVNLPFGKKTPFTAEIYFINMTTKLDITWGTNTPIQVIDPKYRVKLRIRSFGQFGMRISNFTVFLVELMGTMGSNEVVSYEKVRAYFKGLLITKIKTIIADIIVNKNISALEITPKLEEISNYAKEAITPTFKRYGIDIVNFFIESINFPDEDFDKINTSLSDKAAFEIIGDARYDRKRSFDVLETMAGNEGTAGSAAGAGLGIMSGLFAGMAAGSSMTNVSSVMKPPEGSVLCKGCGLTLTASSKFCSNCGKSCNVQKECPNCKSVLEGNPNFCNTCGCSFLKETVCASCGAKNNGNTKFCSNCGHQMLEKDGE